MELLIKKCKKRDRKAQREMLNHLTVLLFPLCMRYAKTKEDAKDLLQESLILIFNNLDKLKSNNEFAFKSWSKKIAINNALGKIRKKKIQFEEMPKVKVVKFSQPQVTSQLHVEDILKLLKYLPEKQHIVFNLSIIDGFSHKEIASFLDIKESSSRTFLVRARQTLQKLLNNDQKNEVINL